MFKKFLENGGVCWINMLITIEEGWIELDCNINGGAPTTK